jgi:hypothetical protein
MKNLPSPRLSITTRKQIIIMQKINNSQNCKQNITYLNAGFEVPSSLQIPVVFFRIIMPCYSLNEYNVSIFRVEPQHELLKPFYSIAIIRICVILAHQTIHYVSGTWIKDQIYKYIHRNFGMGLLRSRNGVNLTYKLIVGKNMRNPGRMYFYIEEFR